MQLGMIGLGRMGANMVRRLMRGGHECVVFDLSADNVKQLAGEGATGSGSLDDFIGKLSQPRAVWIMVPAGNATEKTVNDLAARMDSGDTIIDGGNSNYKDDARRAIDTPRRVASLIKDYLETRPIVARRHYIETGNLRHFDAGVRSSKPCEVPRRRVLADLGHRAGRQAPPRDQAGGRGETRP